MTMFAIKPQFNLAEFLAQPPKPAAARGRSRKTFSLNPRQPQLPAETSESRQDTPADDE